MFMTLWEEESANMPAPKETGVRPVTLQFAGSRVFGFQACSYIGRQPPPEASASAEFILGSTNRLVPRTYSELASKAIELS